jgi:hypothetical protein
VDVDFVRKSIKAIGQTAVKIDEAAERCVNVLLDLIATRVSYVVQEAVVVMKVNCPLALNFFERIIFTLGASRISSGNTHRHTKGSYPPYVQIWTNWTSQKPKPR